MMIIKVIMAIILTPIAGCLITGFDRIISARMQGRKGPSIFQPLNDVLKLMQKESIQVNQMHRFFMYVFFVFVVFATSILLCGGDILLSVFALTLGSIFLILGGYAAKSPYSFIGSERELMQMMSYEPMLLMACVGFYYANKSFMVSDIISQGMPSIVYLPGIFVGVIYILTFKLRKSPFDISTSHHGHQEIVKGITTEYSGMDLAIFEIAHWYETIFSLTLIYIFIGTSKLISIPIGIFVCILCYVFEIIIDNSFARLKWQYAFKVTWIVTGILGVANLVVLSYIRF